jgi:dTDP-L-rhamnose 4-epimerase
MRVLVTGGAGFIGSHVVDQLLDAGAEVRVLDMLHPAAHAHPPDYLSQRAELLQGSVCDEVMVRHAVEGVDAVSHQAALVGLGESFADAPLFARENDLGTAVLLAALFRSGFKGKFVLASSMVVYGEGRYRCATTHGSVRPSPRPLSALRDRQFDPACPRCASRLIPEAVPESQEADPRSVYAATKLHQEHLCFAYGRENEVPIVALRYHNVYGPRMPQKTPYAGVASIFRSALEKREAPKVFEDGRQLRDFVHVDDVARSNVLALGTNERAVGAFNISSGYVHSIGEMAVFLADAYGGPPPEIGGRFRVGDVRHIFASPEKARVELGFTAEVKFEEGMRQFAEAPVRAAARAPL